MLPRVRRKRRLLSYAVLALLPVVNPALLAKLLLQQDSAAAEPASQTRLLSCDAIGEQHHVYAYTFKGTDALENADVTLQSILHNHSSHAAHCCYFRPGGVAYDGR
jgi:hypothetical protein